jgi:proteasome assembly chaperone (PAC2) family protein
MRRILLQAILLFGGIQMDMKEFMEKVKEIEKIIESIEDIPIDMSYTFRRDKVTTQLSFIKRR